jgi:hypothetical protein
MWNEWVSGLFAGRLKKRIAKGEAVSLVRSDGLGLEHLATTVNISDEGMRLVTEQIWNPGEVILLSSPKTGQRIEARVVYCERLQDNRFAVGLKLSTPLEQAKKLH